MKKLKFLSVGMFVSAVIPLFVVVPTGAHSAVPQNSTALERGYRTGYSDGYNAGFKDITDHAARDYNSKEEYQKADRAYVQAWGPLEDYRDGYQQGYEIGYGNGYERSPFSSTIPAGFKKRGIVDTQNDAGRPVDANQSAPPSAGNQPATVSNPPTMTGAVLIPRDTNFLVELQNPLSTDVSQSGDRFQARVIEPREYSGATVQGHITRLQRPGKVKGSAQMQLSFDQVRLPDGRVANLHADLVEVIPMSGDSVGDVDKEGGVKGKSSTKDEVTKVGAATGVGAVIGAIVGGGKGAAIGAAIGAGVGTGSVLTSRGKDIRLARGQQLRIRTSTEASVQ